ncbi:UNVERIFIED_CONTAM: hypothetical protein O8I53_05785 [Campylobacter lari]
MLQEYYFYKLGNIYHNYLNKLETADFYKRLSNIESIAGYQANFTYSFINEIFTLIVSMSLLI